MRTLCIDIGGTGIKAIVLDLEGAPVTERARLETPRPAIPDAVLDTIDALTRTLGEFDRVSIGFPGVVQDGVIKTAPNLDPTSWAGFPLAKHVGERTGGKPVRILNDAAIQGLGVIEGKGIELTITLGTGLGCCVYADGRPVHLELAHHPFRKGKTYEDVLGNAARKASGKKRWNKQLRRAIAQMDALFSYRRLYVGGGNARLVDREGLPDNVTIVDNSAGLLGGIRLWQ
jgi:polyphosphate glucokinase